MLEKIKNEFPETEFIDDRLEQEFINNKKNDNRRGNFSFHMPITKR